MVTVVGEIDTTVLSLLASVTVVPPVGAGELSEIGKATVCPKFTVGLVGSVIDP
jgi:hypothetical protein